MSDTTDHESNDKEERNKNDEQARKVKLDEEEKDENVEEVEGTLYDRQIFCSHSASVGMLNIFLPCCCFSVRLLLRRKGYFDLH